MFRFPELDALVTHPDARATYPLRYEDIAQDGRPKLLAMPPAIGAACFRALWSEHPINVTLAPRGVLPILTGFVIETFEGPISVRDPLEAEGSYQLAHDVDSEGKVARLFLNMAAKVYGKRGRTHGKQPPGAGERMMVGRVFSEHVFTRPFAPAAERKVLRFDVPGQPAVPPERYCWTDARQLLSVPAGAEALDVLSPDPEPVVFGLVHTDSNQHVNSLVYPSLFEQAAVRRAVLLGVNPVGLGGFVEVAYRRPCFAGDVMRLHLQLLRQNGQLSAVGYLAPEGVGVERAHCTLRMAFS